MRKKVSFVEYKTASLMGSENTRSTYQVINLIEGHVECTDTGNIVHCNSTLIAGPKKVIVDTPVPWLVDTFLTSLKDANVECSDVEYAISTQGTPQHAGCNYLFQNAKHIVGHCVSHKDVYYDHDFRGGQEYIVDEFIKVVPTPGFTMQDVSAIVTTCDKGVVAVTGDLFEHKDVLSEKGYWNVSPVDSQDLLMKNRSLILSVANWIVPGRSPMFEVNDGYKQFVKMQIK